MFYLKIRDEKETLFFNGEKTDKKFFEFDIDRYGENLNENNKPAILQKTPVIANDEGEEEYIESFGYYLSLDTESGNTLYDDLTSTIITARLYKDGTPVKIETFKWFVDGAFFSNELYLTVETDDIVENSNIYSLEVEIEDEDEEGENVTVTVSESIEIIYLEGVNQSDPIGDGNGSDDPEYDDPRDWGIKGKTFIRIEHYKNSDYEFMYKRIKNGDDKETVFNEQHRKLVARLYEHYYKSGSMTKPIVDLYVKVDQVLMNTYNDIYEE